MNAQAKAADSLDRKLHLARALFDRAQFEFAHGRYHTAAQAVQRAKRTLINVEIDIERHSEAMAGELSGIIK
jgi:hypothetical protein